MFTNIYCLYVSVCICITAAHVVCKPVDTVSQCKLEFESLFNNKCSIIQHKQENLFSNSVFNGTKYYSLVLMSVTDNMEKWCKSILRMLCYCNQEPNAEIDPKFIQSEM